MAGVKQLKAWFVAVTTDISRLRNFDKPNQQTFENLVASSTFSTEVNDRAKISTGALLSSEQGLAVLANDVQAKANQVQFTDRSLVTQPSQLPTNSTINQNVGDFINDSPLNIIIDGTVSTRNNFIITLKSTFITFLNKWFPTFTGSTNKFLRSNGTSMIFDIIQTTDLPVIPITLGGTGQVTAPLAINALLPTQTGNNGNILTSNGTIASWNSPLSTLGVVPISNGGTGQTTANAAFNALAPSQTSNTGKILQTNGTSTSWVNTSTVIGGSLFDRQTIIQNLGNSPIGGSSAQSSLTTPLVTTAGPNRNYIVNVTLSFSSITTSPNNFIAVYYSTTGGSILSATIVNSWQWSPITAGGAANGSSMIVSGCCLINNLPSNTSIYFGIFTIGSSNQCNGLSASMVIDGVPV